MSSNGASGAAKRGAGDDVNDRPQKRRLPMSAVTTTSLTGLPSFSPTFTGAPTTPLSQPSATAIPPQRPRRHVCPTWRICNCKLHPMPAHKGRGKKNFVPQQHPHFTSSSAPVGPLSSLIQPSSSGPSSSGQIVRFPGLVNLQAAQQVNTKQPASSRGKDKGKGKGKAKAIPKKKPEPEEMVNVQRAAPAQGGERVGDEDAPDIDNANILYDCLLDYPEGRSKNYTGKRNLRGDSFPERSVSLMKARLGISKMVWKRSKGEEKDLDPYRRDGLRQCGTWQGAVESPWEA